MKAQLPVSPFSAPKLNSLVFNFRISVFEVFEIQHGKLLNPESLMTEPHGQQPFCHKTEDPLLISLVLLQVSLLLKLKQYVEPPAHKDLVLRLFEYKHIVGIQFM